MSRFRNFVEKMLSNIKTTFVRFPNVIIFLVFITVLVSFLIENTFPDDEKTISRLLMSAFFGVFSATALQFTIERFTRLSPLKWVIRVLTFGFAFLYYILLTSADGIQDFMVIRVVVICFALFAFYLWIPSSTDNSTFPGNALVHFKSCFISILYSLVMGLGLVAIYFAIDLLLVKLDNDIPAHIFNIMGTFFFPLYYLSLLPDFSDTSEEMTAKREKSSSYPQFLEVLVSYIAIPLIAIFTCVLAIYFIKIAVTWKWPVGELGPMILGYSATGLFVFVLCGRLVNRFAALYRRIFPIALIPLVILQLYSVFIRVDAYGITESRYYLILFGIYSIFCAVLLIVAKGLKSSSIAILAAIFAIISIIPPIDAFSISRNSQAARVIDILEKNSMLAGDTIIPKSDIPNEDKSELTNIMNYMYRMGHSAQLEWLPQDYVQYEDFTEVFGFNEYYNYNTPDENGTKYYYAGVNQQLPLDISGYDIMLRTSFYESKDNLNIKVAFELDASKYTLLSDTTIDGETTISVTDINGRELVSASLKPLFEKITSMNSMSEKGVLPPSELTIDAEGQDIRLRAILSNIGFRVSEDTAVFDEINGEAMVLIDIK